jgi:imidazolonepropionase-like amidohydrolase
MKRASFLSTVALLAFTACAEVEAPSTTEVGPEVIAFLDVNVVPMNEERVLEGQTVLIEGETIVAVGPSSTIDVPAGAARIDGAGNYLIPGLAEMHGHLPNPEMPAQLTEDVLFLYVANGVTTVRGMQGNPTQLELRARINRGDLVGPRLVVGSPSMEGENVETAEEAARLVREYNEAGFDLLKVHEGLSTEVYDAIAATANEVGISFGGHVSDHVGLMHALEAGQRTIDHLDNYVEALIPEDRMPADPPGLRGIDGFVDRVDESRLEQVVEATLEADASVVPTMVFWESGVFPLRPSVEVLAERSELRFLPKDNVDSWVEAVDATVAEKDPEAVRRLAALRRRILMALHRGGARVLLGTDSPQVFNVPGFSIHREMALYVEVGMTPYEVLAAGTRVVGDFLDGSSGTIEEGKRADLILVLGNPLEDIGHVARRAGVMVRGEWIPEEAIQERLEAIAARYPR